MQPGETWEYYVVPVRISNIGSEVCGGNSNVLRLTTDVISPEIDPPQKEEPEGTAFILLQARAGKTTKKSVQIKWKQVPDAK